MSAEIHARTNALGLPFLVAGNVVEPEVGVEVPRCVALRLSDVRCDWELDNWDWAVWEHAPLLDTGDWSELQVTGLASKYLRFDDAVFIRFNGLVHNQSYIHVVFTPNRAYIQNQEKFYYLQLSRLHQSFFHRCDNRIFERFTRFKDLDENIISIHCQKIENVTLQMERWTFGKVNAENYLLVEINKNGTVQLWNTKARTVPMMVWVDPHPIPINFFTIRTDEAGNAQVNAINYGKGQLLSMSKNVNVASITSPPLALSSNKICVSLVYHTQRSTTPTVITVSSPSGTVNLGELANDQDGWKVGRFKATLLDSMVEEEVKVHIRSIKNEGDLHIQRIAGCNADDNEDIATISVLGGFSTPSDRVAYSVAVRPSAESFHIPDFECENGGLAYSEGKCACPAGFTGARCQTGCGANRYGLDCGGLCSLREQECRGLTLCTPIVGCFCAPGYKGYHCNQTCEGRQYGAGCSQRCNNCAGRCDPYTGVCSTVCKSGYYPPYCKTVYSHTQFAPQVNVSNYGEVTVTPDIYNTLGQGKPAFYQVQYKLSQSFQWIVYRTLPISQSGDSLQDVVILGLHHGVRYDVRVVLIDEDLNNYQGSLVPYNQFLTSCFLPEEYDYELKAETTGTTIILSWVYAPDDKHSCPIVNFELSWQEGWRWLSHNVTNTTATLVNKLPITEYRLRVRALTSSDYAPYSDTITVRTAKLAPGPVSNLTLVQSNSTSLTFTWNPPLDKQYYNLNYIVTYECRKLAACEKECTGAGEAHVVQPQVTLQGLHPLAQYVITVAAADGTQGTNVSVIQATQQSVPMEVVLPSQKEHQVTDSAITVYWEPVDVCSGFLREYAYHLYKEDDLTFALSSGTTLEPLATFEDLEAKRTYKVKIFIVTSGGWNPEKYLWINVTTKASVSGAIDQLSVYKTGRQVVGIHWKRPARVYGSLAKFQVSYESVGNKQGSVELQEEEAHCIAWPDDYCHTVSDLDPDTNYTFTVKAQNAEIPQFGPAESVSATTNEKAPDKPTSLQIVNVTSTSFTVSWGYPLRTNGLLRSFLVTLAETERVDYEQCCKQFPNIEIPADVEKASYETEVVGLNPASTYAVSVTGKTIVLGASVSLTVHTQPPRLPVVSVPATVRVSGLPVEWTPQKPVPEHISQLYLPLVRGNIIVILTTEHRTIDNSGVQDTQLYDMLLTAFNSSFFTVADYRGNATVNISPGGSYEGFWGGTTWKLASGETYRVAAVQVAKYFKTFSVDVVLSKPFKLEDSNLINADIDEDY